MSRDDVQPVVAGVVAGVIGFAGTFALVLSGLRAVGATEAQAASGLFAVCAAMGALAVAVAWRTRMPVAVAWSTPGAALLVASGDVPGGWPAAVGAFVLAGLLVALAGLWRTLGRWVAAIPAPLAAAMLAGVLLPICTAPVEAAVELPAQALPAIAIWALLWPRARTWAVPAALVAVGVAIAIDPAGEADVRLLPSLEWTTPELTLGAVVGIAIPLTVVTIASQDLPGMGVLASFGYRPRLGPLLVSTGGVSALAAPFGSHALNLAAITAALVAGPDAHPDPARRWVACVANGLTYFALALLSGAAVALVALAPPLLVEAVAGLALLGALGGALATATADAEHRDAAIVTFVVAASGVTIASVGAPFWGLVAGLAFGRLVSR